jgi:hypothetical protein
MAIRRIKDNRNIELRPDGWERFRTAVAAAAKSGPKHRLSKHKPKEEESMTPSSLTSKHRGSQILPRKSSS